jgi:Tol biopolymer transport system component
MKTNKSHRICIYETRLPRLAATMVLCAICVSCEASSTPRYVGRYSEPYFAGRPFVSPRTSEIIFGSAHESPGDIYSISSDASRLARLTSGPLRKGWPAVSPDGSSTLFAAESKPRGAWHIYVMKSIGTSPVQITSSAHSDIAPSYSPDGKQIVFARAARHRPYSMGGMIWDSWDVWLMNADGSSQQQLTQGLY